jgi:hypothetical protein
VLNVIYHCVFRLMAKEVQKRTSSLHCEADWSVSSNGMNTGVFRDMAACTMSCLVFQAMQGES